MDIYLIYILVWAGLILLLGLVFKVIPAKIKESKNPQTKSSLFTILMTLAIPLILIIIIAPIIIIAGDENMPAEYKIAFGVIAVLVVYFFGSRREVKGKD